jgi:tRNA(Leu) C34 or U34 (ribose-2'-O)-methylase TrmL
MPIHSPYVRSLNLSTSVAIAVYEVLRQRRITRV